MDEEEESFSRTLDRGEKLFEQYASKAVQGGNKTLNGQDVWRLYDTYGFPVDLTTLMAEEKGLLIDTDGVKVAEAKSLEASKAGVKKNAGDVVKLDVHDLAALEKNPDVTKTDDSFKYGEFYDRTSKSYFSVTKYIKDMTMLPRKSRRYTLTSHSLNKQTRRQRKSAVSY